MQRFGRDEIFPGAGVTVPLRRQVHRDQSAIGPIAHEERLLILQRKFRARAENHAGRAADADDRSGGQAVEVVFRPLRAPFAKSLIAAADGMEGADRPVPRRAPVPFHVAVEAEQFAVGVEGDVVRVAQIRRRIIPGSCRPDPSARRIRRRQLAGAESVAVFRRFRTMSSA